MTLLILFYEANYTLLPLLLTLSHPAFTRFIAWDLFGLEIRYVVIVVIRLQKTVQNHRSTLTPANPCPTPRLSTLTHQFQSKPFIL